MNLYCDFFFKDKLTLCNSGCLRNCRKAQACLERTEIHLLRLKTHTAAPGWIVLFKAAHLRHCELFRALDAEAVYTVFGNLLNYYQKTSPPRYFISSSLVDTSHHCICKGLAVGKVLCRPQNPGLVPLNARRIMCLNSETMIKSRTVSLWDSFGLRMVMLTEAF